ncbi:hypothetical protein FMEXI_13554, partial [Fusarium mexicanum]
VLAAVNDAIDTLLEQNKTFYEPPVGYPQGSEAHKGMFGPGGFGSESEYSDGEDTVTGIIPDIPEEIKKIHHHIRKHVESYFSTFGEDYPEIPDGIRKANNKIKRLNHGASRPVDAYLVEKGVLHALRKEQMRVIDARKNKGVEEAEKQLSVFRQAYLNTSRLRAHQWPEAWGNFMEKAIRDILNEINKDDPASEQQGDDSDVDMDDVVNNGPPLTTAGSEVNGNSAASVARPIGSLRPGYTLLGDKIIGYRPMKRYNRYEDRY